MEMVKVRTNELIGAGLDWAVAQVPGALTNKPWSFDSLTGAYMHDDTDFGYFEEWSPSTDWSQGGPLIDTHIHLIENQSMHNDPDGIAVCLCWCDATQREGEGWGATKLIAACRAIVSAHLGDSVDVPAELVGGGV